MQKQKIMEEDHLDQLLTEVEAASMLNYSIYALRNWRVRGGGPQFVKVSKRSIRYRRRDLKSWSVERLRNNTSE